MNNKRLIDIALYEIMNENLTMEKIPNREFLVNLIREVRAIYEMPYNGLVALELEYIRDFDPIAYLQELLVTFGNGGQDD